MLSSFFSFDEAAVFTSGSAAFFALVSAAFLAISSCLFFCSYSCYLRLWRSSFFCFFYYRHGFFVRAPGSSSFGSWLRTFFIFLLFLAGLPLQFSFPRLLLPNLRHPPHARVVFRDHFSCFCFSSLGFGISTRVGLYFSRLMFLKAVGASSFLPRFLHGPSRLRALLRQYG